MPQLRNEGGSSKAKAANCQIRRSINQALQSHKQIATVKQQNKHTSAAAEQDDSNNPMVAASTSASSKAKPLQRFITLIGTEAAESKTREQLRAVILAA